MRDQARDRAQGGHRDASWPRTPARSRTSSSSSRATRAEALPKDADGGLDEDKLPEGGLIGEIEPFAGGKLCKGAFNLAAGKYVLLCNIVETEPNGEKESHFKEGMHAPFVVS